MLCNFLENHDKTRIIDRFLMPEDQNRYSEKMLPVTNFFLPGIVFLYQGQEIGMQNARWNSVDEFDDISTKTSTGWRVRPDFRMQKHLPYVRS